MQPWFMTSPTYPPFTSSTSLDSNLTTPLHEYDRTEAITITTLTNEDEELLNSTQAVGDTVADFLTPVDDIAEEFVENVTHSIDSSTEDVVNVTDDSILPENITESFNTTDITEDSVDNDTLSFDKNSQVTGDDELLEDNSTESIKDPNLRLQEDVEYRTVEDTNTESQTESSSSASSTNDGKHTRVASNSDSLDTLVNDKKKIAAQISESVERYNNDSEFLNLPTNRSGSKSENSTEGLFEITQSNGNTSITVRKDETSSSSTTKAPPSADFIIEKLTNITSSFMKSAALNEGFEENDSTDILIQTNRKLESTEEILIMDRTDNSEKTRNGQVENNKAHIVRFDPSNVTLSPDIQEEIMKLSQILMDSSSLQEPPSPVSHQIENKDSDSLNRNEPVTVTDKERTTSASLEKIVEKRNATADTNMTVTQKDDPNESKNADSNGAALDAQTQQDLLSSSSDAGKNSEYKRNDFELVDSDPISTFTDPPNESLGEYTTQSVFNAFNDGEMTENPFFSNEDLMEIHDKGSLRFEDTTTDYFTSTTDMNFKETTQFQTEPTTTHLEEMYYTTESFTQGTTIQIDNSETITESMITTTTNLYSDGTTPNTGTFSETTEVPQDNQQTETAQNPMVNNEWKIEVSPFQKNSEDHVFKSNNENKAISQDEKETHGLKQPSSRDVSSSEESSSKGDRSAENSGNQEIPGLILNDQFPYLELGGFHISTDTKPRNKTANLQLAVSDKTSYLSNNKKMIQRLIKDNQHLIIINQDSRKDSKEEDTINKFASELEKILNEGPTSTLESTPNHDARSYTLIPHTKNTLSKGTSEDKIGTVKTASTRINVNNELFESVENLDSHSHRPCIECLGLEVDTEMGEVEKKTPIKLTHFERNENEFIRLSRVNNKMMKMISKSEGNDVPVPNKNDLEDKKNNSSYDEKREVEDLLNTNIQITVTPTPDDGTHGIHMEEFTLEPPQSLFEIKAERIDENAEGKLFYDAEKFKKPPEIVYPDEYPEEFMYINSPPLLIVTSTVYTSVPDIQFITTQMTDLGLSWDYFTEEYKGDKAAKRKSEDRTKDLKSESWEHSEDDSVKNQTLTTNENKDLNSIKIGNVAFTLPNHISLTNITNEANQYNETVSTQHNRANETQTSTTIKEMEQSADANITTNSLKSVMKIPKKKQKRENQKLLRELEHSIETLESTPSNTNSDRLTGSSRNNARHMKVEDEDAEWVIPTKSPASQTKSVNKMAEDPDSEWIVPQNRRDKPKGRQIPMEEDKDAEWINPPNRSHQGNSNRRVFMGGDAEWVTPPDRKQGRQSPMEEEHDAEWITPPSQNKKNSNRRTITGGSNKRPMIEGGDTKSVIENRAQGQQHVIRSNIPLKEEDAEWITPQSRVGVRGSSFNREFGEQTGDNTQNGRKQFPMLEADAEWITTKKTTTS